MSLEDTGKNCASPKRRSREQLKSDLVQTALKMFLKHGVQATSMADIGRAQGISKPTVYELFDGKQALVNAALKAALREIDVTWVTNAHNAPVSFDVFLDQSLEACKEYLRNPKGTYAYRLVMQEGVHSGELLAAFLKYMAVPASEGVMGVVARAIDAGECRRMDVRAVQKLISSPMYFLISDRAMFGENALSFEQALAYLEACFAGIRVHLCLKSQTASTDKGHAARVERRPT